LEILALNDIAVGPAQEKPDAGQLPQLRRSKGFRRVSKSLQSIGSTSMMSNSNETNRLFLGQNVSRASVHRNAAT
jgi:hypothetical protein